MNFSTISQSKKLRIAMCVVLLLLAMLLAFEAGEQVGYRKSLFSHGLGENYFRAFGDPHGGPGGFMGGFPGDNLTSTHGAVGTIVRIALPTFVVASPDNVEKVIAIDEDTSIRRFRDTIESSDLKVGDSVIVLGDPNEKSEIFARLIRIIPALPNSFSTSTATTTNQ